MPSFLSSLSLLAFGARGSAHTGMAVLSHSREMRKEGGGAASTSTTEEADVTKKERKESEEIWSDSLPGPAFLASMSNASRARKLRALFSSSGAAEVDNAFAS